MILNPSVASRASRSARSVGDEPRPATPLTRVQTGKVTSEARFWALTTQPPPHLQQDETQDKLDYVLALSADAFPSAACRPSCSSSASPSLCTTLRVLIKQRHIRVGKQIVNVPSFLVRTDSQKHIDFALNSPLGGGRPGRVKRKRQAAAAAGAGGEEEDEE